MNIKGFYTVFDQMSISKEEFLSKKSRELIELVCPHCGEIFLRPKNDIQAAYKHNTVRYCSKICSNIKIIKKSICVCENCGKEHSGTYGSGRFCSSKCARGFATKANRKEITNKMRNTFITKYPKKVKPQKLCKICGQETCLHPEICKSQFLRQTTNLEKLGFNLDTIGTLDVYKEYKKIQKYLFNLYYTEEKSYDVIMKLHDIPSTRTLDLLFKFFKIERRSLGESIKLTYLQGRNNPSSNPKFKHGYHTSWNNQQFYYRSSYELDYMKELDSLHIEYEYEKVRIKYEDTRDNTWRVAVPDFYLPETNTLVEIKSEYTYDKENMEDKVAEYRKLGFNFKLILEHQEYNYCV